MCYLLLQASDEEEAEQEEEEEEEEEKVCRMCTLANASHSFFCIACDALL